jgi:murein DD-endopeptidase MepM/ murein hydrolase activator NlpD
MKINGTVRDVFATLQPLAQSGETDYIANAGLFPEQGRSAGRRGWKWPAQERRNRLISESRPRLTHPARWRTFQQKGGV